MRVRQPEPAKGSLYWLRQLVYHHPNFFASHLTVSGAIPSGTEILWVSPRADDQHAEYRDQAALDQLGLPALNRPLSAFWPSRGPQWDALGKFGDGGVILVEAKANLSEFASDRSGAKGRSLDRIERSCTEVQKAMGVPPGTSWTGKYYQYANRLAHLYFLRSNGIDTRLVFVYFVHEPHTKGPTSEAAWKAAICGAHAALGLRETLPPSVHEVFIHVRQLSKD